MATDRVPERSLLDLGVLAYRPFLFGLRLRNTEIDRLFYDVGALSKEERVQVAGLGAREGEVLVVSPARARAPIRLYRSVRVYLDVCGAGATAAASEKGDAGETGETGNTGENAAALADAFVVAGVGKSALGCAALARNVADHLGRPVAGIVSDYDVADFITEAIGGWFSLGLAEELRGKIAHHGPGAAREAGDGDAAASLDLLQGALSDAVLRARGRPGSIAVGEASAGYVPLSADSRALLWLLCDKRAKVGLLVGHGNGSVSVANALIGYTNIKGFATGIPDRDPVVVTLGTAVPMPSELTAVHQFVGQLDWYGWMRSTPGVPCTKVPRAWHHLNTELPHHLKVEAVLRQVDLRRR